MIEVRFTCDKCGYQHIEEFVGSHETIEEIIPDGWDSDQTGMLICEDCIIEKE